MIKKSHNKIKELQKSLVLAEDRLDYANRKKQELEKELEEEKEKNRMRYSRHDGAVQALQSEVRNLLEIIRWKTDSDTTRYPFRSRIDQLGKREPPDDRYCGQDFDPSCLMR